MNKNVNRLFFGMLFGPAALLLHECGHYLASKALGLTAHFHFAEVVTTFPYPGQPHAEQLVTAGGPAVEATLTLVGFVWLWKLRRNRPQSAVTQTEWFATFLSLCVARWLRCITGTPGLPQPADEAWLSASFGFPPWLFPYLLAFPAAALLTWVVRLHPRGSRLIPIGSAFVGLALGALLWLRFLGPRILP